MFIHNINPVLLSIGPISIRYYGLVYFIGFLFAYFFLRYQVKRKKIEGMNEDKLDIFMIYLIVGVLLGARLFEFLFYIPNVFLSDPLEFFRIWNGGMSYHGGLFGAIVAGLIFTKKYKIKFYRLADLLIIPAMFFVAVGRIANFINGEIPGTRSGVSWCVVFPGVEGCRHPYVLYESLKNFFVFGIALYLKQLKAFKIKEGLLFWWTLLLYNGLRFVVDFVRDEPRLLGFTMGQALSFVFALVCVYFIFKISKKSSNSYSKMF
jgi:phosphatidylglycerol:prolipoprotein diacylglycerol transferase